MKVLSLGWGVQSFTLAAMSALGHIDPLDYAIHADTNFERTGTYAFAVKWTPWLESHGVKVLTTKAEDNEDLRVNGLIGIPARTASGEALVDGEIIKSSGGQLRRMCTNDWKIAPMRRVISRLLAEAGIKKRNVQLTKDTGEDDYSYKNIPVVEMWLGISLDEFQRMKPADVKYISHRWPLIELKMTRQDCVDWLLAQGLEVPPKSFCTFCPYHKKAAWIEMREDPDTTDWNQAVWADEIIRKARPPFDLYLHSQRKPLVEAVQISTQMKLPEPDENEECGGVCFV